MKGRLVSRQSSAITGAAALLLSGAAWAHHFMGDALPQTFVQGLLSGMGHPLIGVDHAAFIIASGFFLALVDRGIVGVLVLIGGTLAVATAAFWFHRRIIAARESWAKPVSVGLGGVVGAVGIAFLALNIAG